MTEPKLALDTLKGDEPAFYTRIIQLVSLSIDLTKKPTDKRITDATIEAVEYLATSLDTAAIAAESDMKAMEALDRKKKTIII